MAYVVSNPKIVVDTKDLVLTVNGVPQTDHEGNPIMDEKAWLEVRKGGIGGSDASTIMGTSPWRSRQQLMDEKRGVCPMKELGKNNMALTIGHMFEGVIRYKVLPYLLEQLGITNFTVGEDSHMYCHGNPDYSFARADIDGLIKIVDQLGIVEIKTTNWRNKDVIEEWTSGIVPPYYEAQCRHYMAVMNLNFVYICCAWGFNPETEAVLIRIDRNMDLERQLMDAEREFWEDHVELGLPIEEEDCSPSVARAYYCSRMIRSANEVPVALPENDLEPLVRERQMLLDRIEAAKKEQKDATEELDGIELSIMQKLGNNTKGSYLKDPQHRVTVYAESQLENKSYDIEAIEKNCPQLYEKAAEVKFSASKLTNSEKALIKPYLLPQKPNGKVKVKVYEAELDASGNPVKKTAAKKKAV